MDFTQRKAVSPIIASLLLIAIAVAAGIIVYIYVNSLSGNLTQGGGAQVSERLQMQSYSFSVSPPTCACAQWVLDLNMVNSGGGATTISAIYFDGTQMTVSTPFASPATALTTIANNAYTAPSSSYVVDTNAACTSGAAAQFLCFSAATTKTSYSAQDTGQVFITFGAAQTAGTTHTVKVISLTGATYVFTVTAGRSG